MRNPTPNLPTADVCIVGTGPAGLAAALTLGSAGHGVILLESGRSNGGSQQLNDGDCEGVPYEGLERTRHRQVGGTANIWNVGVGEGLGAKYVPLSARDVGPWPIEWKELEPYYREAQKLCGLGPFEYDADYWATSRRRPFHLKGTGLTNGIYQFGTVERFTRVVVDLLHGMEGVTIVPSTTVVGFLRDTRTSRIRGVHAFDDRRRSFNVLARSVILACGAVENARLLLLAQVSNSRWLGRCFMEHARDFSLVLVPRSLELFADAHFYDQHTSNDVLVGGRLGVTDEALDAFGLPNASMTLVPRARRRRGGSLMNRVHRVIRAPKAMWHGRYGWSQVPAPAQTFDVFRVVLNLEQRPHMSNRIELGHRRDRFGNALPHLILNWSNGEQALLDRFRRLLDGWFQTAELGRLTFVEGRPPDLNAHHHAGTTRMSLDPRDGVVDPYGRLFELDNLYLAGASVFPTAGFANPTLTVVALALRLARHLSASL